MAEEAKDNGKVPTGNQRNRNRNRNRNNQQGSGQKQNVVQKAQGDEGKAQQRPRPRAPVSNPEIPVKYTLNSREAIRLQQRSYNSGSQALFQLSINSLHLDRLGVKGASQNVAKAIKDLFSEPQKQVSHGISTWENMLNEARAKRQIHSPLYSAPREYNIVVRTPSAMDMVNLIQRYDQLIMLVDTTWLNNMVIQDEVNEYKEGLRDTVRGLIKKLEDLAKTTVDDLNHRNQRGNFGQQQNEELTNVQAEETGDAADTGKEGSGQQSAA